METDEGILAVKAARTSIEAETQGIMPEIDLPDSFDRKSGVFVTINTYPDGRLRGCIGYPEPVFSLRDALIHSAQSACHDPRFMPLSEREAATSPMAGTWARSMTLSPVAGTSSPPTWERLVTVSRRRELATAQSK